MTENAGTRKRRSEGWGPTSEAVAANVLRLRKARGLTTGSLSELLKQRGHSIPASGVTRIEKGDRRVDVDDLIALAAALNVSPLDLLLPAKATDDPVSLTTGHAVTSQTAWQWALGQRPAMDWEPGEGVSLAEPGADPAIAAESYEREQEYARLRTEYVRLSLPQELRRGDSHPLVQLASQVRDLVEDVAVAPGDRDDRLRWIRMAQRRLDAIEGNLEEVSEALTTGDGLDDLKKQYPGLISHVEVAADGTVTDVPPPQAE